MSGSKGFSSNSRNMKKGRNRNVKHFKQEEPVQEIKTTNIFSELDENSDHELNLVNTTSSNTGKSYKKIKEPEISASNISTPQTTELPKQDFHEDEWQVQETRDSRKKKNKKVLDTVVEEDQELNKESGKSLLLNTKWNVWIHKNESNNWTASSYQTVYVIDSVSSFWRFFNNIYALDYVKYQFYIMRETSCPTWEHPTNRNGGTCSIRLPKDRMDDVLEQLSLLILNESFNNTPEEINGISFGVKANWGLIKIWNSNHQHDISQFVPSYLVKKYSATPRYKKNEPEY
jgi:hypothetical protein